MTNISEEFPAKKRTSRLGIASLVIAIAVPVLLVALVAVAALMGSRRGSPGAVMGLIFIILGLVSPLLYITGAIFGIVGWISKKTNNLVPIFGTVLNSAFLVIGIAILVIAISSMNFAFH